MELTIEDFPCYTCITRAICKPVIYYENHQYALKECVYLDKFLKEYGHFLFESGKFTLLTKIFPNEEIEDDQTAHN